jgi:hypothetical protein
MTTKDKIPVLNLPASTFEKVDKSDKKVCG